MIRLSRGLNWLTEYQGSTRSAGLVRCGWGLILWARWADELLPFRSMQLTYWVLGALFFLGSMGMVVGLFSRTSCLLTGVVTLWMVFVVGQQEGMESWSHHHTTFLAVVTFILAFTPCGGSFSLDRWLAIRRAERSGYSWPVEWGNVWALRLVSLQLSAIYFWGAFDKMRWAVLGGDRIEQPLMYLYFGSDYPGAWFHWLAVVVAWSTIVVECSLAIGLWVRRFQRPLMMLGLLFHVTLYYALPVTVFSIASILAYLAYIHPDTVHRAVDRMMGLKPDEE
jgi:uncharacterized membrane protein YphA (DoxX/SURF4 family)